MKYIKIIIVVWLVILSAPEIVVNQIHPPLYFKENWRETPAAIPITQEHVLNPQLILNLYGMGKDSLKKSHHDQPFDDPYYIWSGLCKGNWAVTFEHKSTWVNLSGLSKIRWRSRQSGFRKLHIILKLADGTWVISEQGDGQSNDWRIREFNISDIDWNQFDIHSIAEGNVLPNPDLSKVAEIGFTDLMDGEKSQACSRLDWIEVYGTAIKRD